MGDRVNGRYWDRARDFFRRLDGHRSTGSYFVHLKGEQTVRIGLGVQRSVRVGAANRVSVSNHIGGVVSSPNDGSLFRAVGERLIPDVPSFFLVSPDVRRSFSDDTLPRAEFVQPALEFVFSPEHAEGSVSYAAEEAANARGQSMLREAGNAPSPLPVPASDAPADFSRLIAEWTPAEDDSSFLSRLGGAVESLQSHPDGKMTLSRAYERSLPGGRDPFDLYSLHARGNGDYACSHFFCIRPGVYSLGTSPENVFEVSGRTLTVDVVAATCKADADEQTLAAELTANPKQLKEHQSSLASRQARFRPYCTEDSLRVLQVAQVKRLRNVLHLHSVFAGELRPEVSMFDLMEDLFPLLGARPPQLRAEADAEPAPHRYFGGLVGYRAADSASAFLNIRNLLIDGDTIHAKVGVGVIAESNPLGELVETRDKLSGVLESTHAWAS